METTTAEIPRVIFIEKLSEIIGKAPTSIRTAATNEKYKHLIPRPFKMPHSRRLAWCPRMARKINHLTDSNATAPWSAY